MNNRLISLLWMLGPATALVFAPPGLGADVPPPNGPGGALSFNVGNEYLDVPDDVWFSGDFTVEGWVYVRSHNNWSRLLDFGNGEGIDNVLVALSDGTTGKPHFHVVSDTVIGPGITTPNELPLNQWTHLACVLSGTTGTIYVNGSAVVSGPVNRPRPVLRTGCYFGRSNWAADADANAIFDELRIWNVARNPLQLRATRFRQLFGNESGLVAYYRFDENAGLTALDSTGNANNTATLVNGPSWVESTVVPFAPPVRTLAATDVSGSSATLNGWVDGRTSFSAFEAYFEWGTSTSLGNELRSGFLVSPGAAPQNFSAALTGLVPGTVYFFRAVALNANGASYGATQTFPNQNNHILTAGVIAGGGGQTSGGGYFLTGTIGQWEADSIASGSQPLSGGFWGAEELPRLRIQRTGDSVLITWLATRTGFQLQQSPAVAGPLASWGNVPQSVALVNGENQVTLSILSGGRFFRLRKP